MHRAVLSNQALAQRRGLFEVLSIIGYLVAAALCVFCVFNWVENANFVFFCTAIWALFSLCVVARLWWTNPANKRDRVLEFPETWVDSKKLPGNESPALQALISSMAPPASDLAPSDVDATPETNAEPAPLTSVERIKARAEQLKRYRDARLLRYKKKRSTVRAADSNLSAYLQKF